MPFSFLRYKNEIKRLKLCLELIVESSDSRESDQVNVLASS